MQGTKGKSVRVAASTLAALCALAAGASSASAAAPVISETAVSGVATTSATLEAKVNPEGLATKYHFEYGTVDCAPNPFLCTSVPVPDREVVKDENGLFSPELAKETVTGLTPGTIYHFRLVASNPAVTKGPDHIFATYSTPLGGLPEGRAYEQASPVDKNGNDADGEVAQVKAAASGGGITFGSNFGIPGGKGAQSLPFYLAKRGPGQSGWSSEGLLPPETSGERADVVGWSPDFTEVFSSTAHLGEPIKTAFLGQPMGGGGPVEIAPYTESAEFLYAGESTDGSTVFFEAPVQLSTKEGEQPAAKGFSNLYAWDRASGNISLAGALNDKAAPPKGAFGGAYDWAIGAGAKALRQGGAGAYQYLRDQHAISTGGDAYFTAAGTGQLYLRQNPTQPQSALNGQGECTEEGMACTIQVSASLKTNGKSKDLKDPVGPQPAAFQAASADGSEVLFTSPEKLTNQANTGPEQPEAAIGLGAIGGGIEDKEFIPQAAVGVAVDSEYIYWANPTGGTIGRAKLNGAGKPTEVNESFIVPGPVEFKEEVSPGVFKTELVESEPRYVAVANGHIYWTNTGRRDELGDPLDGGGTIGRAKLNGAAAASEVKANFITGASNPQGIAVNASHIYWANAARAGSKRAIGRGGSEGEAVEQVFHETGFGKSPRGVALSTSDVYFSVNDVDGFSFVGRIPLEGGDEDFTFIGKSTLRGIATDATNVYWAAQGEGAIGRIAFSDFPKLGPCESTPGCKTEFTTVEGALNGLAADSAHLYWSVNGEAATNPGNDLYRFVAPVKVGEKGTLEDLTVKTGGNGAEVQGVVGLSDDGSDIYFVANGVLDDEGKATPGSCHASVPHGPLPSTKGNCNLYASHEGAVTLVARLGMGGDTKSDALDWVPAPLEVFGGGSYLPKTSFLSKDGATLLFRSQEKLSAYDNEGVPELYRYRAGEPALRCVSCRPSGEAVGDGPSLGSIKFPEIGLFVTAMGTASRNLSADGEHAFFESAEALSPTDTNGAGGCLRSGTGSRSPACLDVYEWTAEGVDSCQKASPGYSPLNAGCVYLISTGKDKFPSLFADASESGEDVFFFTRQSLVGQDKDQLQDVYDARSGGGLASQNPSSSSACESAEACHESAPLAPAESSPASAGFSGPANPKKQMHKKHKHKKQGAKKHKKANAKRGARR